MKLIKSASGKTTIKMSKNEWTDLGKKAGWMQKEKNHDYNDLILEMNQSLKSSKPNTPFTESTARSLVSLLEEEREEDAESLLLDYGISYSDLRAIIRFTESWKS